MHISLCKACFGILKNACSVDDAESGSRRVIVSSVVMIIKSTHGEKTADNSVQVKDGERTAQANAEIGGNLTE